jgi:hypothetical protein
MSMQSPYIPFDVQSLWNMNRDPLGDFETSMQSWFGFSGRVQEHAIKFMSSRLAKDTAALAQLGQCKTPVDALNVQMTYLAGACADYMNEGQTIAGFLGDVARESLPGPSAERAPTASGMPKRSPHRAAH